MSKHWNPKESARYRHRARARRKASGGAGGFTWGEIRLTLLGGLFAGLAYAFVPRGGTAGSGSAGSDVAESEEGAGSAATSGGGRGRGFPGGHDRRRGHVPVPGREVPGPFELHAIDRDEDQYGRKLRYAGAWPMSERLKLPLFGRMSW